MSTYEIRKSSTGYILLITHPDGSQNDYRFGTKKEMTRWLRAAGLK
jgi:hypothetical protein